MTLNTLPRLILALSFCLDPLPPRPPPATHPTSHAEALSRIHALQLPPVNYNYQSLRRFNTQLQSLDKPTRERLLDDLTTLINADTSDPDIPITVLLHAQVSRSLDLRPTAGPWPKSAWVQHAFQFERISNSFERFGNVPAFSDEAYANIPRLLQEYPNSPFLLQLMKRRVELYPSGPDRELAESEFLTNYPDSNPAKQLTIEKSIGHPFALPKDKPTLLHFYVPKTLWGEAHLLALKALQENHKDQFHLQLIPFQLDDPFIVSQGLAEADLPLTYLLAADGTLASIRHDTRLEKPLQRLLK